MRGRLGAECRTHAAATSIILNISLLLKLPSSLGSTNCSQFPVSSALINWGLACQSREIVSCIVENKKKFNFSDHLFPKEMISILKPKEPDTISSRKSVSVIDNKILI